MPGLPFVLSRSPGDPTPDPLSGILESVHVRGGVYVQFELAREWGVAMEPWSTAVFHALLETEGWLILPGQRALRLRPGDVVVLPHGDPHRVVSSPGARCLRLSEAVVGRVCADGSCPVLHVGARPTPGSRMVCGYFDLDRATKHPLLGFLPRVLRVRREASAAWLGQTLETMDREVRERGPGFRAALGVLSELLFVHVLRAHLASLPAQARGLLAATRDASLGRALARLHAAPGHAWTLGELAREAGASRSALAERFSELVGVGPMRYLAAWRMHRAAAFMRDEGLNVAEAMERVGYQSQAAFSRAFRRHLGSAPGVFRKRGLPATWPSASTAHANLAGASRGRD